MRRLPNPYFCCKKQLHLTFDRDLSDLILNTSTDASPRLSRQPYLVLSCQECQKMSHIIWDIPHYPLLIQKIRLIIGGYNWSGTSSLSTLEGCYHTHLSIWTRWSPEVPSNLNHSAWSLFQDRAGLVLAAFPYRLGFLYFQQCFASLELPTVCLVLSKNVMSTGVKMEIFLQTLQFQIIISRIDTHN